MGNPCPNLFVEGVCNDEGYILLIFFTEVIKFYWLMLLFYPGELYRASSSGKLFIDWCINLPCLKHLVNNYSPVLKEHNFIYDGGNKILSFDKKIWFTSLQKYSKDIDTLYSVCCVQMTKYCIGNGIVVLSWLLFHY